MSLRLVPHAGAEGRPLVMGVLNVTPDSFSDGGRFNALAAALDHACRMAEAGADVIDVGGESTRPGADPVPEAEELERVVPVIEALGARVPAAISIDTRKPAVAEAAVAAGAALWNDVGALRWPGALEAAAALGVPVVLMHMQGEPGVMQQAPRYADVVGEVAAFLEARKAAAIEAGVEEAAIWVDPGIGFGKTLAHNLALLRALPRFAAIGPLAVGVSRKSFIAKIEAAQGAPQSDPADRLGGSLAGALIAAQAGAAMLRVHDVAETVQALRVARAITGPPS